MKCRSCGKELRSNGEANEHLTISYQRSPYTGEVVGFTPICNETGRPG